MGQDFAILPQVKGAGRFLGCHAGVIASPQYMGWWGEGEVKVYLDGDTDLPTQCGTGTEDYIATAWGQGEYAQRYHGCLLADNDAKRYAFYRYHIPDPVYFDKECRVTIQQIGGTNKKDVLSMVKQGRAVQPISADADGRFIKLWEEDEPLKVLEGIPDSSRVNYYREDDVSAVAFFYLAQPSSNLPALAPVEQRTAAMEQTPRIEKCNGTFLDPSSPITEERIMPLVSYAEPQLDFQRLEAIAEATSVPLVLHGGSGISDSDFEKAILTGIRKINIYTDMSVAASKRVREMIESESEVDYPTMLLEARKSVKSVVVRKMRTFGSSGKA